MENTNAELGARIKSERKRKKMTQQQLASGICSQSMLSSIENNTYIPNVILFAQLCERLNLSLEKMLLHPYPTINQQFDFNQTIIQLCNAHHYLELKNYLLQNKITDQLVTNSDWQTYYYYLGIATYQINHNTHDALYNLSLAGSYTDNHTTPTTLELLIRASGAFINYLHEERLNANLTFLRCLEDIEHDRIVAPNDNLNSIFYLYAYCLYQNFEFELGLQVINRGITYITAHNSHFMLADLFLLKSVFLTSLKHSQEAKLTAQKAQSLSEIFNTELYSLASLR